MHECRACWGVSLRARVFRNRVRIQPSTNLNGPCRCCSGRSGAPRPRAGCARRWNASHEISRQIDRERQVVPRVDEQRLPIAQPFEIPLRADRLPQRPAAGRARCGRRAPRARAASTARARRRRRSTARCDSAPPRESAARAPSSAARGTIRGSCRECRCDRSPALASHAIARRASSTACRHTCTVRATLALTM